MAVPSNFLSPSSKISPSPSLFFLKFHPKTHSLKGFGARKPKISCCQQTVEVDTETQHNTNLAKKKRKPRPSFLEQVQNKWSLKTPSLRQNFPWQEQENGDTNQQFQAQTSPFSSVVSSDKESEKSSPVSEPLPSHTKIKSTLAPWVHGNEPRKKVFNSKGSIKSQEKVHQTEHLQNEEPMVSVIQGSDDLVKKKIGEFDEIPIGLPEKNENLGVDKSKNVTSMEDLSISYRVASSVKCSAGADDLKRLPWERKINEEFVKENKLRNRNTELAERLIPEHELKRLRNVSLRMVERMKVGAAGVTQELVDAIHEKWKDDEVVKLKFEGPPSMNMKRTHEFLESRTGGLVIWRSGSLVVLYRGMTYKLDCIKSYSKHVQADSGAIGSSREDSPTSTKVDRVNGAAESPRVYNSNYCSNLSEEEQVDLRELNLLLDELGPRFVDWSGREPLPVDADLLPAVVPGYKTPFRLLPHGTKQALQNIEMTYLRRTARTMPPHFALGRSRELQGLAKAMVKLWEKSAIAKIAIKRGVLNTSNERMAEELKILTGGTLVSRNKEFIVFYRGNDFLPPAVSSALVEAEKTATLQQDEEEQARHRAAALIDRIAKPAQQLVAGTLAETVAATSRWGNRSDGSEKEKMMRDTAVARLTSLVNSLERKLTLAKGKFRKAEKALGKVLENQEPENLPTDLETLTDEERFLFRRIGLSMKPYLILGRNLLTKRQALARSIELQRREALKHHILELEEKIEKLKQELALILILVVAKNFWNSEFAFLLFQFMRMSGLIFKAPPSVQDRHFCWAMLQKVGKERWS
ncbi:hypothetical protein DH2020_018615 [Rehmannia glutinosa]|uniref:CRM domain-containing protein n=1 Tax=Rehmannia glutinosa TaxID=99300 RepID=A0ABR0WJE7_REHGL